MFTYDQVLENIEMDFFDLVCGTLDEYRKKLSEKAISKKKQLLEQILKPEEAVKVVKDEIDKLELKDFMIEYSEPQISTRIRGYMIDKDDELVFHDPEKADFTFPSTYEFIMKIMKDGITAEESVEVLVLEKVAVYQSLHIYQRIFTENGIIAAWENEKLNQQGCTLKIRFSDEKDAKEFYEAYKDDESVLQMYGIAPEHDIVEHSCYKEHFPLHKNITNKESDDIKDLSMKSLQRSERLEKEGCTLIVNISNEKDAKEFYEAYKDDESVLQIYGTRLDLEDLTVGSPYCKKGFPFYQNYEVNILRQKVALFRRNIPGYNYQRYLEEEVEKPSIERTKEADEADIPEVVLED